MKMPFSFLFGSYSAIMGVILGMLAFSKSTSQAAPVGEEKCSFISAQPIWPTGQTREKNLFVGFRTIITAPATGEVYLRVAAASVYRTYVNGEFLGYGPARGPHGFQRIDQWPLHHALKPGKNVIAVEIAAYNVNNYYMADQPAFFQAEVIHDGQILSCTGTDAESFQATVIPERLRKVQRYSFQRPFIEVYRVASGYDRWRSQVEAVFKSVACSRTEPKKYLPRRAPYPVFNQRPAISATAQGRLVAQDLPANPWKDRSLTQIGVELGGFPEAELTVIPSLEMQRYRSVIFDSTNHNISCGEQINLTEKTFQIYDLGTNLTGFIGLRVQCQKPVRLLLLFDEILSGRDVDFSRLGCVNIISYDLQPGEYALESFEPYTMRYIKAIVMQGACQIGDLYLREYVNPDAALARFSSSDRRLNRLFEAARETFRQNAVDGFTDCPSRERAGWLCDSYFTSRVALDLCGNTSVEKMFFENFLLPAQFPGVPDGMLPMCYPADHPDGNFIPNWALWFVVQLPEYLERSGDRALVDALQPRVEKLLQYMTRFQNSDGLLEKLPAWVFVEWSKANEFVQDVNYPSNMLYAGALDAAAGLYNKSDYHRQAEAVREIIRRQSFDGEFFVDNAVRSQSELHVTSNRTEACQYYAFFFGIADLQRNAELWEKLIKDFGPHRKKSGKYPDVYPANTFVGDYMRLELLSRAGLVQQILSESVDYFFYMAERTGTLWENRHERASCNHGFASHIAHVLVRDVLGVQKMDVANKVITLRFAPLALDWCEAELPLPDGKLGVRWWHENGELGYEIHPPLGWRVEQK
jgi:alpha-L-rhamnosidase